jgi:gliding motility-associated-like protein
MSFKTIIRFCLLVGLFSTAAMAQPVAEFSADKLSGCAPLIVKFADLSTGGAVNWSWEFGNGNTSTLQNPSVIYTTPGVYEIKLTVKNAANASSVKIKTGYITVYALPGANFTVTPASACPNVPFSFTDASTNGSGTINQWQWDFDDGLGSNTQNVTHAYTAGGSYKVRLTISDNNGCSNFKEIVTPVTVFTPPDARFTPSKNGSCLAPATIAFTNQTSGTHTYRWEFGDGNTSTQTTASNTFVNPGSYTVKLIATSSNGCADTGSVVISIGNNKAGFTASPPSTCINSTVTFLPDVTGSMLGYTFLYGDGQSSDQTQPSTHSYAVAGTYNVSLIAFFGDGCSDTVTKTIVVDEIPDVEINYTPKSSCLTPFNVTFTNPVSNSTSFWRFGDGQTSSQKNVIHTYNSKGPFVVDLTVTTAGGCEVTKTDTITFTPKLNVLSSQKLFCGVSSGSVTFDYSPEYTTPSNPIAWNWDFGDGNTSTQQKPTHNFTTEGKFIVKLALSYAGGCVIEGWDTINIFLDPYPDFVANLRDACVRKEIEFINLCTNCDSAIWDFGDKIVMPVKLPMPPGTNAAHKYYVNPKGILKLTDTFDIKLTVFNGPCQKDTTFKKYIRVRAPLAYTEPVTLYCDTPGNAMFTDISRYQNPRDSVTRLWVFGDPFAEKIGGLPCTVNTVNGVNIGRNCNNSVDSISTHIYKRFGDYNAYLRTYSKTTGCLDSFQFTIKVRPKFNLRFTASPDTGCAPLAVTLKDTTKTSAQWKWIFGDPAYAPGDTAISRDTAWKYNRPGNYTVRLLATDTSGCQQTTTMPIVVRGPLANFNITGKLCHPDTTKFTDLTTKTSRIQKWKWAFGDPGGGVQDDTSSLQNPVHKFSKSGNFVVSLSVTDSEQCVNTVAKLIPYGPPKPDYSLDKDIICQNMSVAFTNNTPGSNTFTWLFGDTAKSTVRNPVHTYADTGTFQVKLIAKRTDGCADSISHLTVRVVKPQVDFTADNTNAFCPPFTVKFNDIVSGDIIGWRWDFGDSSYSTVANPIKTYNKPGIYSVKLHVTSAGGCEDSIIYIDYIRVGGPVGTFTFNPKTGCVPHTAAFKVASAPGAATYPWDLGDGNVATTTADSVSHTYTRSGIFKPVLILTDTNNCSIPYPSKDSIYLLPGSKANFTASDTAICIGGSVVFTDKSTTPAGVSIVSRHWDFGDLLTGTTNPVAHIYTTSGSFDVSLAIVDDRGCTDTVVKPSYIESTLQPIVTASNDTTVCAGAEVQLNASGGVVYRWTPVTGLSDAGIPNPVAKPLVTTAYKVAAKGAGNCDTAYATVIITVNPLPTVNAGPDINLCFNDSVQLNATSSGNVFAWYPPFGLSDTTITNPYVKITHDTTYYLQVTDANFCINTDSVFVKVIELPQAEITGAEEVCYGAVLPLNASGGDTYLWSTGETTESIVAIIKADTSFWVIPFTQGCKGTSDTINIRISGDVIEAGFTTQSDTLFTRRPTYFTNTSQGGVSWYWDFMWNKLVPGKTSTTMHPVYDYDRAGNYTVMLVAISDIGCRDTIFKELTLINNDVFIPNVFTPDGDKINDFFHFVASDTLESFVLSIYNRWGELLFETRDENIGWDGTAGGAPAQQDVYVYEFRGIVNRKEVVLSGTVTLLR